MAVQHQTHSFFTSWCPSWIKKNLLKRKTPDSCYYKCTTPARSVQCILLHSCHNVKTVRAWLSEQWCNELVCHTTNSIIGHARHWPNTWIKITASIPPLGSLMFFQIFRWWLPVTHVCGDNPIKLLIHIFFSKFLNSLPSVPQVLLVQESNFSLLWVSNSAVHFGHNPKFAILCGSGHGMFHPKLEPIAPPLFGSVVQVVAKARKLPAWSMFTRVNNLLIWQVHAWYVHTKAFSLLIRQENACC